MGAKGNGIFSVYAKLEMQDCLIYDDVLSLCFLFVCSGLTKDHFVFKDVDNLSCLALLVTIGCTTPQKFSMHH